MGNYIAIKRIKNRYAVWEELAENEKPNPLKTSAKYFETYKEAVNYANRWCSDETEMEYGVVDLDSEEQTAFLKIERENVKKTMEYSMSKEEEDEKTIFNMDLHELVLVKRGIHVLKVSDGWLYKWGDSSPVFVPLIKQTTSYTL